MDKKSLNNYETSFLILISLIIGQIFLVFVNIYYKQSFPIESFTIIVVQLIAILLSYFFGLVIATFFSLVYIIGYIFYILNSNTGIDLGLYILLFFVPLSTIIAGSMNRARKSITMDLIKLDELESMKLKIDPHTNLDNEFAFKEILSKNANLAYRYPSYYFSVSMFRLEFIETLKTLLGLREFNELLKDIAKIIDKSIREEDYKFIVKNDRFTILNPLASSENISPALMRILEEIYKLDIRDRNGDKLELIVKLGSLDFSKDQFDLFKDSDKLLLELEKSTEVDVYGEYNKQK